MDEATLASLFVVGCEGTACDPQVQALLDAERPGGLILFQRNLVPDVSAVEARAA